MAEPYRLRRGTPEDTRPAFDVFLPAIRDLTTRQGSPWEPDQDELWAELSPMLERLAVHAAEWWVAEDPQSGELIGYARSVDRGGLFELTELFVHPSRQSAGVGADLISHAFPEGRGEVRAIIATTDVRAQARYYGAGTAARFPIVAVEGPPHAADLDPEVEIVRLEDGADTAPLIEIESAILEFDRGDEFAWLLAQREGYLYRRAGAPIGFSFVSRAGMGPIAALDPDDIVPILSPRRDASRGAPHRVPLPRSPDDQRGGHASPHAPRAANGYASSRCSCRAVRSAGSTDSSDSRRRSSCELAPLMRMRAA